MITVQVKNRLRRLERVPNAVCAVDQPTGGLPGPTLVVATANARGIATLGAIPDGLHSLSVTAPHSESGDVGPGVASTATPPDRIYRPLQAQFRVRGGYVVSANAAPANRWGTVARVSNAQMRVELQPVWMRSPNHGGRGSATPSIVVVHHTGGATIQGALSTFLGGQPESAHYVIDTDGNIIKMVQDARRANHAGTARWNGLANVNASSIGIEIVHQTGVYPKAQYRPLIGLLNRLVSHYPNIDADNIVGHSDVATNAAGRLGRKPEDPGLSFDWPRVESQGLGMIPRPNPQPDTIYGGFFALVPGGSFRRNDNDAAHRYGGAIWTGVTGTPVQQIQKDLSDIGYSAGTPNGDYGERTHSAVRMFQMHFFAGGRGGTPNGCVDFLTATMILNVL